MGTHRYLGVQFLLKGTVFSQAEAAFLPFSMFNKHTDLLSRDLSCRQAPFKVSCQPPCKQELLSPRTSLEALTRGLSVWSHVSSPAQPPERQERPEGRHCSPVPHTSSSCLGWSQHTPGLHTTACLDCVFPHHLLPRRGRKRPQLYKHYTSTFCSCFQSPVLLYQSSHLSAQPWASSGSPLVRCSEIYRPR